MNRRLWGRIFKKDSVPNFPCPRCGIGQLVADSKTMRIVEPTYSKSAHNLEEWEPDWTIERFSFSLNCSSSDCGEIVNVIGDTTVVEDTDEEVGWHLVTALVPRAMYPRPRMIEVPDGTPHQISEQLDIAFGLFWVDIGSAANRLRTSVEYLLDDLKVPRQGFRKDNSAFELDLNGRIQAFQKQDPTLGETFDALRMVGNLGSHTGELTQEAFLDSLEIYEDALAEIYGQRSKRLAAMRSKIISSKGKY